MQFESTASASRGSAACASHTASAIVSMARAEWHDRIDVQIAVSPAARRLPIPSAGALRFHEVAADCPRHSASVNRSRI
jgi:hypothetical protein